MLSYSGAGELPTKGGMPDFAAMGIDLNLGFVLTVFPFILAFFAVHPYDQTTEPEELRDCGERRKGDQMGKNIFLGTGMDGYICCMASLVGKK